MFVTRRIRIFDLRGFGSVRTAIVAMNASVALVNKISRRFVICPHFTNEPLRRLLFV